MCLSFFYFNFVISIFFLLFSLFVLIFHLFFFFSNFSFLFPFFLFFHLLLLFLLTFCGCPSRRQKLKNSREILMIKMTIFLCENFICGPRWTGRVRNGPFEGDPAFMFAISLFHFYNFSILFSKIVFLCLFQICFTANIGIRVSLNSVVGAPCGVLMTKDGKAGIGLGRLLGGEHDSTPCGCCCVVCCVLCVCACVRVCVVSVVVDDALTV